MQREIKFRVWDKVDNEMMLPGIWEEDYVGGGNKKIGLYIYRSRKDPIQHSSLDWILRHPESFELMQFTGLKDKNGREIYEGDIFGNLPQLRCVVKREKDGAYKLHFLDKRIESISILDSKVSKSEVIGNIHENPELLK